MSRYDNYIRLVVQGAGETEVTIVDNRPSNLIGYIIDGTSYIAPSGTSYIKHTFNDTEYHDVYLAVSAIGNLPVFDITQTAVLIDVPNGYNLSDNANQTFRVWTAQPFVHIILRNEEYYDKINNGWVANGWSNKVNLYVPQNTISQYSAGANTKRANIYALETSQFNERKLLSDITLQ